MYNVITSKKKEIKNMLLDKFDISWLDYIIDDCKGPARVKLLDAKDLEQMEDAIKYILAGTLINQKPVESYENYKSVIKQLAQQWL